MPPQFPTASTGVKRPAFHPTAGGKRPALLPAAAAPPPRKIARPASAPCLPALANKKIPTRPVPSPAPPSSAARPRPPVPSSAARTATRPKKPGPRPAVEAEAAPCRAAESVHPSRRLACGTAVIVRTRVRLPAKYRCCLLLWLPARVVSSSDAYHCTVKYAADLNPIYASKIARVPAADVRHAPSSHRSSAAAKADHTKKRPHLQAP